MDNIGAKGDLYHGSPTRDVSEETNVGMWPRDYCGILMKAVDAFCP